MASGENLGFRRKSRFQAKISASGENLGFERFLRLRTFEGVSKFLKVLNLRHALYSLFFYFSCFHLFLFLFVRSIVRSCAAVAAMAAVADFEKSLQAVTFGTKTK